MQYCTWAHGGVSGIDRISDTRQEKVAERKRRKNFEQFIKEPTTDIAGDELCAFCNTIDFERIFSLNAANVSDHGLPVLSLNYLTEKLVDVKCSACAMFASMAFGFADTDLNKPSPRVEWHLRAFPASCLWGVRPPPDQVVSIVLCLVRELDTQSFAFPAVGPVGVPEELDHAMLEDSWKRGLILSTTATAFGRTEHGVLCNGVYLQPRVNYERVTRLLAECTDHHLECANYKLGAFPRGARVIDCTTREIVDLVANMQYLALSYVWGNPLTSQAVQALSVKGQSVRLIENAPQTIEDAITVTKRLGYNFLWIDRYCIPQHNHAEKKDQIDQMASIYSYAIATICATGEDANSGLYGVSKDRKLQHKVISRGLVKCPWPEFHIREHLKVSKWSTRGWTYQEPLLSKKCLFFTPETVVQVCHTRTFEEAISVEYNLTSCFTNRTVVLSSSLFMARLPLCMSVLLPRSQLAFTQAVQQYQKRDFSYDSDSLDAFEGFLSMIKMSSYWGVPIARIEPGRSRKDHDADPDHMTGFVFGLLWITTARQKRWNSDEHEGVFTDFPSWSWVSRRATLTDFLHHGGVLKSAKIRSFQLTYWKGLVLHDAQVRVERADGNSGELRDLVQGFGIIPEHSKYLIITGVTARWRLGATRFGTRVTGKLKAAYFPTLLLDEVSDPMLQPHLAQTVQTGPARIAFDQGYAVYPSTDLENHPDAPAKEGLAILLLITGWPGKLEGSYTYWLALRKESDDTYRREGMIECHLSANAAKATGYQPPGGALTTIRLG